MKTLNTYKRNITRVFMIGGMLGIITLADYYYYQLRLNAHERKTIAALNAENQRLEMEKETYLDSRNYFEKKYADLKEENALLRYHKSNATVTAGNDNPRIHSLRVSNTGAQQTGFNYQAAYEKTSGIINTLYSDLNQKSNELAALNSEIEKKQQEINALKFRTGDFMICAYTDCSCSKPTTRAKHARNIRVSFDIAAGSDFHALQYRILAPDGTDVTDNYTSFIEPARSGFLAGNHTVPLNATAFMRTTIAISPQKRMKAGIYSVEIMQGGTVSGTCKLQLY